MWRWQESSQHFKYVWLANGGREQLFNLAEDPHELRNLASSAPARCAAAHAQLVAWCRATDFPEALSPDGSERLSSYTFEPIPLGEVNKQAPVWPARDPDFRPA